MPHPKNKHQPEPIKQYVSSAAGRRTRTEDECDRTAFPRAQRHQRAMDAADERAAVMHMAEVSMVHVMVDRRRHDIRHILTLTLARGGGGHVDLAMPVHVHMVRRLSGIPELLVSGQMRDVVFGSMAKFHVGRNDRAEAGEGEQLGYAALHLVAGHAHARGRGREDHRGACLHVVHGLAKAERAGFGRGDDDAQRRRAR